MNHILCFVGGALVATAVCVSAFGTWRQPDKDLILRCRQRVQAFRNLPAEQQKAWLDLVNAKPALHTRWRAICALNNAFGGVEIALP